MASSTDRCAYLWVVEIKFSPSLGASIKGWSPTVGVSISRRDARAEQAKWQRNNPEDKFRVRRYRRVSK